MIRSRTCATSSTATPWRSPTAAESGSAMLQTATLSTRLRNLMIWARSGTSRQAASTVSGHATNSRARRPEADASAALRRDCGRREAIRCRLLTPLRGLRLGERGDHDVVVVHGALTHAARVGGERDAPRGRNPQRHAAIDYLGAVHEQAAV